MGSGPLVRASTVGAALKGHFQELLRSLAEALLQGQC